MYFLFGIHHERTIAHDRFVDGHARKQQQLHGLRRIGCHAHFDLIAIDSLEALYSLSRIENPRRELFHFFGFLRSLNATSFLISEIPSGSHGAFGRYDEEFLADGILHLKHAPIGDTDVQLRIRCVKMRRSRHEHGDFALVRSGDRFQITRVISK